MAQVKFTTTDIFARLAKGECANFRNGACVGGAPCAVLDGAPCDYFAKYVKPLLDFPEFDTKYRREAKVTVALNPKAKVVRRKEAAQAARAAAKPEEKPVAAPRAGRAGNRARRSTEEKSATGRRATKSPRPRPAAKTPPPVPASPLPPQPAKARKPAETAQQLLFELPATEPARKRPR